MKRAFGVCAAALLLCGPASAQQVSEAQGAQLRGIDKINGEIFEIRVSVGQTAQLEFRMVDDAGTNGFFNQFSGKLPAGPRP